MASPLSFQPWFFVPLLERVWYSRYPSWSASPNWCAHSMMRRAVSKQRRVQRHAGLKGEPFVRAPLEKRKGREVADIRCDDLFGDAIGGRGHVGESVSPVPQASVARSAITVNRGAIRGTAVHAH